jgi:DNA-binding XRE family transcriptional regulator
VDLLPRVTLKYIKPLYTLGQHIKQGRAKQKISQPTLAKKFGVNTATICQWENDKIKNIPPKYYPLLAEFLGFCFIGNITKSKLQKSKRLYQGLSQKEYAKLIGKSSRDICKIEHKM